MRRALLVLLLMACCCVASAQQHNQQRVQKLNYVYSFLRNNYVDELDLEPLVEEAIRATLSELDPHSSYISRDEMQTMLNSINAEFVGIGISFISCDGDIVINRVIANTPAEKAGLHKNDRIISVDNTPIRDLAIEDIGAMLRGKRGSIVQLVIERCGKKLTFNIKRDDIESKSVGAAFILDDGIAYVSVESFLSRDTAREFVEAVEQMGNVDGIVIDLRDNAGGLLSSALEFAELFLLKGDAIVTTQERKSSTKHTASKDGRYRDIPIAVLINENSASASELVAGALQDHKRATIVGRRSFGKGLVQKLIKLGDGSGVKITTARYLTPAGRVIQRPYQPGSQEEYFEARERYDHLDEAIGGIMPDIHVGYNERPLAPFTQAMFNVEKVEKIIVEYFDRVDIVEFMKQYPTLDSFATEFEFDDQMREWIIEQVAADNTELLNNIEGIDEALEILKGALASDIYGSSAYYYIYGQHHDLILDKALEVIREMMLF